MRFTRDHVWIEPEGEVARVGVTAYIADQLDDLVLIDLPPIGRHVRPGEQLAVLENPERSFVVRAPVEGYVVAVNEATADAPDLVNAVPELGGWLVRLKLERPADVEQLLDRAAYEDFLATL
jgi:glycine cleavage system H protein